MDNFYLFIELIRNTLFQCKELVTSLLYPCLTCSLTRRIKLITYIRILEEAATLLPPAQYVALFCSDSAIPEFLESTFIYYAK